jgi:hypothetical protein
MNDSDFDFDSMLRERFAELRTNDERRAPSLGRLLEVRPPATRFGYRAVALALMLIILVGTTATLSVRRAERQRAAARQFAGAPFMRSSVWQAPTDVLLKTPGRDLLATVPRIGNQPSWLAEPRMRTTKGASS